MIPNQRSSCLSTALIAMVVCCSLEAADYTVSGMATQLEDPRDLEMENIRILRETTLGDGRVLLEVSAELRNLDEALWEALSAHLNQGIGAAWQFLGGALVTIDSLGAGEIVDAGDTALHMVVSAADLAAAEAAVTAGAVFELTATLADGALVVNPVDLILTPRVVEVIQMADGRFIINIGFALEAGFDQFFSNLTVHLVNAAVSFPFEQASSTLRYDNPPLAYGLAQPTHYLNTIVEPSELTSARTEILNGHALEVIASELWVYNARPVGIDEETSDNYVGGSTSTLIFSENSDYLDSLRSGDLILADPGVYRPDPPTPDGEPTGLANCFPFEVTGVAPVGDAIHVTGQQRDLLEVLKSATFVQDAEDAYDFPVRNPYDPELENTYTEAEMDEREETAKLIADEDPRDGRLADLRGLPAIPWHFNDKFVTDNIKVSGEMLLRSSGLKLEIKIRNFQLQRAVAHIDAGVVLNMVVETDERRDPNLNLVEELIDAAKFRERVPPIPLNIGGVPVTLQPVMYFNVGANANIPQGFVLPLQSSFIVGLDMGWERGRLEQTGRGYFYEFSDEFIPVRIAEPTIFDDLAGDAEFWVEFGAGIEGTIAATLDVSPTLAVRLQNDFTVAPFDDPWWNVNAHGELIGRFAIDFLGMTAVDSEATLLPFDLYRIDAGGPLLSSPRLAGPIPRTRGFETLSGRDTRWASAYQASETAGKVSTAFLLPGPNNEVAVVFNQTTGSSWLKYDGQGELLWAKEFLGSARPYAGAVSSDDTVFLSGFRHGELWLGAYDNDGNEHWVETYGLDKSFTTEAIDIRPVNSVMVAGHLHHGNIRTSDPALISFDEAGQVLWSKYYASEGDDEAYDLIQTRDGHFVLCGASGADVEDPPRGDPDSGNTLKNATDNGLLMKVDADGNLLWAKVYASRHGMRFRSLTEGPNGALYVVGDIGRPINVDYPVILAGKFQPDGTLIDHVTVGDDLDWEDELPNGGNSPWDRSHKIVWTDEGPWLCGATGLGDQSAGWVISMTDELGVRMYSIFDGEKSDSLLNIMDTGSGLAVVGATKSLLPWGTGGSHSALLMHLPFEAMMRFHEDTRFNSLYLQPRVFHSSADLDFTMIAQVPSLPPRTFVNPSSDVPFLRTDFNLTPTTTTIELASTSEGIELAVEKVERALVDDYEDWADYHKLSGSDADPDADADGDGLRNIFEAFFGRNPYVAETTSPVTISSGEVNGQPVVVIEFDRSTFTQTLGVTFESGATLDNWLAATGLTEVVQPLSPSREHVQLVAARDVPIRFFRVVSEVAGGGGVH